MSKWISVKERLPGPEKNPEKHGHSYWGIYIVSVHSPNISDQPIVIPANWTGEWKNDGGFHLNVTHWQPLPESPTGIEGDSMSIETELFDDLKRSQGRVFEANKRIDELEVMLREIVTNTDAGYDVLASYSIDIARDYLKKSKAASIDMGITTRRTPPAL